LDGVTGPEAVAEQQGSRFCRNLLGELDNDQRGQIVGERRQSAIPFLNRKRSFPRPAH
jgi:hypothetical protein